MAAIRIIKTREYVGWFADYEVFIDEQLVGNGETKEIPTTIEHTP